MKRGAIREGVHGPVAAAQKTCVGLKNDKGKEGTEALEE